MTLADAAYPAAGFQLFIVHDVHGDHPGAALIRSRADSHRIDITLTILLFYLINIKGYLK
jgi:hypothetical protein